MKICLDNGVHFKTLSIDKLTGAMNRRKIATSAMALFLPGLALTITVTMVFLSVSESAKTKAYHDRERHTVDIMAANIDADIMQVSSDLAILTHDRALEYLWDDDGIPIPDLLVDLTECFLNISRYRRLYDQVRLLDENGMEIIRVNFNSGRPLVISREELQNKKDRYYFDDTFKLNRGEVFVSPLDLNIEQGEIEQPLKPMIRFATPVFDRSG